MPHTSFLPLLSSIGPLGRRLLGLFAAVLALSLLGSAIGLWALQHIGVSTDDIVQRSIANERLVADAYRLQAGFDRGCAARLRTGRVCLDHLHR